MRFCGSCGTQLNWPTQQIQPPSVYQQQQQPAQQTTQAQHEDVMASLINFAAKKVAEGKKKSDVEDELTRMGVPYPIAAEVVNEVFQYRSELLRKEGGKQIGCGLLMLIVGGIVTGISYTGAAEIGGGYIITTGLFFVGTITLIYGLYRWLTN